MTEIVQDEDVLGGEPRIRGTRVGVRHVSVAVVDAGQTPAYVADQLDLSLAEVYAALSYYYDNVEEIQTHERQNAAAFDRLAESSLKPNDPVS